MQRYLHGWAGDGVVGDRRTLVELGMLAVRGRPDRQGWPTAARFEPLRWPTIVQHPLDPGVWLGDLRSLDTMPRSVTGVVSLCRVGNSQARVQRSNHAEIRLIDRDGANPNLDLVLEDAVDAVATMRAEGREVLLHCFGSASRTAAVAALYGVRRFHIDVEHVLTELSRTMPNYGPQYFLLDAVRRLAKETDR